MAPITEVWKPDGVIGWNERHADEECGSGEASREDQRQGRRTRYPFSH
jgi:hypothetical protein